MNRLQSARYIMYVGLVSNIVLVLIKGIGGWLSGSKALIADATNSFTDVISSVAIFLGIRAAHIPPDDEHPYGHGKAETISAVIVSVLIAFVGLEVGKNAIGSLFEPPVASPNAWAIVAALFSIAIKEGLYRYTYTVGNKLKSQLIMVSAWDHRADVVATFVALLGILISILGDYIGVPQLLYFDPIAGLGVCIYVIWIAYTLAKESISHTLDRVVEPSQSLEFKKALLVVKDILEVNDLRARHQGHYLIVDVKLSVDSNLSVAQGHAIGKRAKQVLLTTFPAISDVLVHINPCKGCENASKKT